MDRGNISVEKLIDLVLDIVWGVLGKDFVKHLAVALLFLPSITIRHCGLDLVSMFIVVSLLLLWIILFSHLGGQFISLLCIIPSVCR